MNSKALTTEFIGTFALIFIGAGAGAISGSLVATAFAHGLVVLGFAYAYGHISGTHINPAVTIGLLVGRQIDVGTAVGYIIAQLAGGVAGAGALAYVLGEKAGSLGATVPAEGVGDSADICSRVAINVFPRECNLQHRRERQGRQHGPGRDRFDAGVLHFDGRAVDWGVAESGALVGARALRQCADRDVEPLDLFRRLPAGRNFGGVVVRVLEGL